DGLAKRVEVHDQQIDAFDAVLIQSLHVFGAVTTGQQTAVDLRVQRLDPPIQYFGRTRMLGDFGDFDAGVCQQAGGATGGQNAYPTAGQGLSEVDDARLVGDGDESGLNFHWKSDGMKESGLQVMREQLLAQGAARSEERRVGRGCRGRWW